MATAPQIAANRLNAQKSMGPKTPEGRAAVRLNGVKHGITAQTIILKGESAADFTALLDSYAAEHHPATPTETALVEQLAMATWRLRRLYRAEAAFSNSKLTYIAATPAGSKLDGAERIGLMSGWEKDTKPTIDTFNRQESRLERTFYRALHELQRLRKLALVSQNTAAPVFRKQFNNIEPSAPAATEQNPLASPAPEPETTLHLVPPTENMQ
jgi:hypothetical protein